MSGSASFFFQITFKQYKPSNLSFPLLAVIPKCVVRKEKSSCREMSLKILFLQNVRFLLANKTGCRRRNDAVAQLGAVS